VLNRCYEPAGLLIASGIAIAIIFPYIVPATLGFLLVGFAFHPWFQPFMALLVNQKRLSPGLALAAVSSISFFGFLLGPTTNWLLFRKLLTLNGHLR
jgi:hypothetical protein